MKLLDKLKVLANKGAEEAGAILTPSLSDQLLQSNLKHSRNGDVLGHLVESLAIKLQWALQDPTVLNLVTNDEIEALTIERDNFLSINKQVNKNDRPF